MGNYRKLIFSLVLAALLAFLPFWASAEGSRYFVKSTKGFWKNALGVRHEFPNGFTTEASDFQLRLAKVFGVEIEPVAVFNILPNESATPKPDVQPTDLAPEPSATNDMTPSAEPTKVPEPKALKGKNGSVRYLPSDQTPWGVEVIYNNPVIALTVGGESVNVAILDTGVAVSHPDLKSVVGQCKDFTNSRFPVIDGKCDDKNGHGTHVAGIIAANAGEDGKGIYGIAPQAKIFAYKVCGANGSCYADDIAIALRAAADLGANIANMSFGSDSESGLIKDAIAYASSKGVLMVAAAGNDGPLQGSIDYPGANASVAAVGAIGQSLSVTDWSSRGINSTNTPWVIESRDIEFAAPGQHIESTWNNGGYAILSGTSMASPFMAGLAAKYWQTGTTPAESAALTRDFMHSLATDLLPEGDDDASGFGLPQVR